MRLDGRAGVRRVLSSMLPPLGCAEDTSRFAEDTVDVRSRVWQLGCHVRVNLIKAMEGSHKGTS